MPKQLFQSIAPALTQNNPSLSDFKEAVKSIQQQLIEQFDEGVPVHQLIRLRSLLIDQLLLTLCKHSCPSSHVTLVAVGGYGRQELHPASDIDILLLVTETENDELNANLESLLTTLWDIGLEIGHSVRTIDECLEQARNDATVMTNLLESRFLFGNHSLYNTLDQGLSSSDLWTTSSFFSAKQAELINRHNKYDDTSGNLEPNIKESPGGLRDIQTIVWICMKELNSSDLSSLVDIGFLTDKEYNIFYAGLIHLWEIRFALHLLTGKHEDRLLFDYQKTIASRFGHINDDNNLAVEQFMQGYYRTATEVYRLTEMLLALFEESHLQKDKQLKTNNISKDFISVGNQIQAVDEQLFKQHPSALLEIFLVMQQHPEISGIRANTIRQIRENTYLIDDQFRQDKTNQQLFIDIMSYPEGLTHELRRMNHYGILAAYLPEFEHIVGQMQYDLFHAFTVDEHSLFVVRNMRRLAISKHNDEFPLASKLLQQLEKPEILYIAGLFHDIGKGCGGDHSKIGAEIANAFGQRHGLPNDDIKLIVWLVENHLNMSLTAQRKDIEDPEVIRTFANLVGSIDYLNHLYLLTLCDSRATNPRRWNSWRNSILVQLYQTTLSVLENDQEKQSITQLVNQRQSQALSQLIELNHLRLDVEQHWATLNNDYFIRCSVDELVAQTDIILSAEEQQLPIIKINPTKNRGSTEIFMYGDDTKNLFARTTRLLDQMALNIVSARLITSSLGKALNSYSVLDQNNSMVNDTFIIDEIERNIKSKVWNSDIEIQATHRIAPRQFKHFDVKPKITLKTDSPQPNQTTLFIRAANRLGLLADISEQITDLNLQVLNARISTVGEIIEDFIILQTNNKTALSDEQLDSLFKALSTTVGH